TLIDINAALDGMTFAPDLNYNGPATVQISTSDLGNTGSGGALVDTDTVNITINAVNDSPILTLPGSQVIDEDNTLTFSSASGNLISVADVDVNEGTSLVRI